MSRVKKVENRFLEESGKIFEVVKAVPKGYQIWNVNLLVDLGYLPLAKVDERRNIDGTSLKAIYVGVSLDVLHLIMKAVSEGFSTLRSMELYLKRYEGKSNVSNKVSYKVSLIRIVHSYVRALDWQ